MQPVREIVYICLGPNVEQKRRQDSHATMSSGAAIGKSEGVRERGRSRARAFASEGVRDGMRERRSSRSTAAQATEFVLSNADTQKHDVIGIEHRVRAVGKRRAIGGQSVGFIT